MVFRYDNRPSQFFLDTVAQDIGGVRLTMDNESLFWWRFKSSEPLHDFIRVGMRREHVQGGDFGAHVVVLAVDFDPVNPGDHRCAPRAARLESGKQDGIAGVRHIEFQMVRTRPPVAMPLAAIMILGIWS